MRWTPFRVKAVQQAKQPIFKLGWRTPLHYKIRTKTRQHDELRVERHFEENIFFGRYSSLKPLDSNVKRRRRRGAREAHTAVLD